ncbi:nuclear transport factor 2 family protein [Chitinophagaceae bacterium LB-8]|uniref:Nuclear transport factor 2 family protein n=1 Tax=Paraflavisolibacter caeni TaxID=2982496 RepID=A0A9X2XRQ7_9BACT|nr:nuclear transport factor 2 family protein [Paraflavisolibacter caeni]MCU7547549.1 nuclear transport factor 2 family protein [Paraflavisolibacter caeni]
MIRKQTINAILAFLMFFCFCSQLWAQTNLQELTATILHKDSLFWAAYNKCDTESFPQFFTNDVEFYHDKGGMTIGLDGIISNMKKNLCGTNTFRLRREAVEGSVKVFPLQNSGVIYGAVISGEHVFYIIEKGTERLDGLAKFTHVWLLKDGTWKMARILSYDHGPANRK